MDEYIASPIKIINSHGIKNLIAFSIPLLMPFETMKQVSIINIVCHKINFSGSDIKDSNFAADQAAVISVNEPDRDLNI